MSNFGGILELKSPLTKECWDKLADVELENTERMWFTTPNGKRVEYIKADVLEQIRDEIQKEKEAIHFDINEQKAKWTNSGIYDGLTWAQEIIDKHTKG